MKLIKLAKFEIYDGLHAYGDKVEVYYLPRNGIITSNREFIGVSDKRFQDEASQIESFLQNPIDLEIEARERRIEEMVNLGFDKDEARKVYNCLDLGRDCYLRVLGQIELSDNELEEFLEAERRFQTAREKRNRSLDSLIKKIE